jgi:acyl dehydratase
MATRTATARNWATTSDNKIHDDEVARTYGFRGGLVPGVTLFSYLVPVLLEDQGEAWLDGGWVEVRFVSAVYEGDDVSADCTSGVVTLRDSAGQVCVSGEAWRARAGLMDRLPGTATLPAERPPASVESLAPGRVLGALCHEADADTMARYVERVGDDASWWIDRGVAHPGWLLLDANEVLARNVVLGPWIHVGSRIRQRRRAPLGARIDVRAEVADCYERKGHRLVDLDVVVLADGEPAMRVAHTAIWEPRARQQEPTRDTPA